MEKRTNQKDELNKNRKRRIAGQSASGRSSDHKVSDRKSSSRSFSDSVKRAAQKQRTADDVVTVRAKEVFRRRNRVNTHARTMEEFENQRSGNENRRSTVTNRRFDQGENHRRLGNGTTSSRAGSKTGVGTTSSRNGNRGGVGTTSVRSGNRGGVGTTSVRSGNRGGVGTTSSRSGNRTEAGTPSGKAVHKESSNRRTNAVRKRRMEQEAKRRKNRKRFGCLLNIMLLILLLSFAGLAIMKHLPGKDQTESESQLVETGQGEKSASDHEGSEDREVSKAEEKTEATAEEETEEQSQKEDQAQGDKEHIEIIEVSKDVLEKAELLAAQYDYEKAIEKIKEIEGYENVPQLMERISKWKSAREDLVAYNAEDVIHIFYHTLVVDPELAFECAPSIAEGFKMWMTTTKEFDRITQKMYDDGYVLCSLYDFFEETKDGDGRPHFKNKSVYLPADKKPFILSLDDLSYYHTYTGRGMATKLVLDENGKVTCEYKNRDGSISRGPYDCVPRLNDFMEAHPDGCYRGARGTIALTGYNGIFGYRTDKSYVTRENLDKDKQDWLNAHPDYDYEKECAKAKKIANELKEEGWDFASHTWGHIRIGKSNLARIQKDTEKWKANVEPIIGHTECIIFAHGQDLAPVDEYDTATNKKYQYLTSKGFHIYLNVDSHQKTMKVHDEYVHGGRRNLDGYRLWNDAHGKGTWTNDLFDASTMLDERRKDMPNPD